MKKYTLNALGQTEAAAHIQAVGWGKELVPEAFFADIESAAESGDQHFELGRAYTGSKNPELIELNPAWFDVEIRWIDMEDMGKVIDELVSALKTTAMALELAGLVPGDAYWQQQGKAAARQARDALVSATGRPS